MADERLRKGIGALRSTEALSHEARKAALEAIAGAIDGQRDLIHRENGKDIGRARDEGISQPDYRRAIGAYLRTGIADAYDIVLQRILIR